jgi:hypothetical protein
MVSATAVRPNRLSLTERRQLPQPTVVLKRGGYGLQDGLKHALVR